MPDKSSPDEINFAQIQSNALAARFDDPVAKQTKWTAAKMGGSRFRTVALKEISPQRMEFRPALEIKIYVGCLVFICYGLAIGSVIGIMTDRFTQDEVTTSLAWFVCALSVLVGSGGIALYCIWVTPSAFDKRNGYFWKGRTSPDAVFDPARIKHVARLDDIHAIQLISERVSVNCPYSHELNLVLRNGDRINIADHNKERKMRRDAGKLSEFLGVPIWDAIVWK